MGPSLRQWTGNRWIGRLHVLLQAGLVVTVLYAVGRALTNVVMAVPGRQMVDQGFDGLLTTGPRVVLGDALAPGVRVTDMLVEVSLYDAARAPLMAGLYLFTWLPGLLMVALALYRLLRITTRAAAEDRSLFSADTVSDLRGIGTVLVAGALVTVVLDFLATNTAARMLMTDPPMIVREPFSPVVPIMAGVGAFVVAEVVRRGLVMLDDLEGTI